MQSAWRERGAFLLLSFLIVGLLFRDAILHGYVLGQGELLFQFQPWRAHAPLGWRAGNPLLLDSPTVFYPFLVHAKASVWNGQFPLWNSSISSGIPFFATFQSAVLSPFTLIGYLVPLPHAVTLIAAAHLIVGGLGMFVFLRSLGLSLPAATFGGVAYLLNPFSMVWLEHPLSAVAAWLPWLLMAVDRCMIRQRGFDLGLVALTTALALVSGHPETLFKVMLLVGAYAIYRALGSGSAVRSLIVVAAGVLLGALVSSVQLVPFFEYLSHSRALATRAATVEPHFTIPPIASVTAFVPDFFGNPTTRRYLLDSANYFEQQIYPGIATWILAIAALAAARHRGRAAFFVGSGAVAALIMYGTIVATIAVFALPPLRVAALSRFGLLTIAGLVVAAACAVDRVLPFGDPIEKRERVRIAIVATIAAAAIAAVILTFFAVNYAWLADTRQLARTTRGVVIALSIAAACVAAIWAIPLMPRRVAAGILIVLVAGDLFLVADGFHPLRPRETTFPPLPEVEAIKADRELFRVAGWNDTLIPNSALIYGLQDFRGIDAVGVRWYSELLDVAFRFNGATHVIDGFGAPHLLDLLNVKYLLVPNDVEVPAGRFMVIKDGPVRVYRNLSALPRVFLADAFVALRGDDARRALRSGTIDLRGTVVLEQAPVSPPLLSTTNRATDAAIIRHYDDERVTIDTSSSGARLLVLTDVDFPGWIATVDGEEVPIQRANFAFRAVSVPEGKHIVEFRYRPRSFTYGLFASAVGVVLLAGCLARYR
jgi:hypothetical protein